MAWFILSQLFSTLIYLIRIGRTSDHEKELEIIILRYQLAIVERKLQSHRTPSRAEKLTLAVLLARLKQGTQLPAHQLQDIIRIFQPETVLRWHRDTAYLDHCPHSYAMYCCALDTTGIPIYTKIHPKITCQGKRRRPGARAVVPPNRPSVFLTERTMPRIVAC
jgi:hypothetical protein